MAYYIIKSEFTEYVLDCEGGAKPGHKVIPFDKHGGENQVFYDDEMTGTIRPKGNPMLCLDVEGEQLVVKPYQQGDANQQWRRDGKFIRNRVDTNKVLDVFHKETKKGAKIGMFKFHGGPNQSWEFQMVGGAAPTAPTAAAATSYPAYPGYPQQTAQSTGRQFYMVAELNGKVIDVEAGKAEAGARLLMWDKHSPPKKNQLWYTDSHGYIRSCLNDMAFTNTASTQVLKTQMPSGDPRSQWMFQGNKVINRASECLDISRGHKDNGAEVISFQFKDSPNQHFRQEFV